MASSPDRPAKDLLRRSERPPHETMVYRAISQHILAIYRRYTPLVEPLALDEAYLDIISLVGEESTAAARLARDIKQDIVAQTSLTAAEQVESRLAELEIAGKTITLKLRWHDFQLVTRSESTPSPIHDAQAMMRSLRPLCWLLRPSVPKHAPPMTLLDSLPLYLYVRQMAIQLLMLLFTALF